MLTQIVHFSKRCLQFWIFPVFTAIYFTAITNLHLNLPKISNMRIHRIVILCCLFVLGWGDTIFAQTLNYTAADTQLDSAVHMYNRYRDATNGLKNEDITASLLREFTVKHDAIYAAMNQVIEIGSADNIKVANYFKTMTTHELAYLYGRVGNNTESVKLFEVVKSSMLAFQPSDFKMNYKYENKNYSIAWENAAPTILEFMASLSELYMIVGNHKEGMALAEKVMVFDYTTEYRTDIYWYRYIIATKYLNSALIIAKYDNQSADMAINQILVYNTLGEAEKAIVLETESYGYASGINFINNLATANPQLVKDGQIYAKTGGALKSIGDYQRAAPFYIKALNNGFYDYTFIIEAYDVANASNNNELGLLATAQQESRVGSTDCAGWRDIATKWYRYGNTSKGNEATERSNNCEAAAAEIQREYEKEQAKQARRDNLDFSVYAGIYPLPLIIRYNKYRDYGGVFGFGLYNIGVEFSYKLINLNHVIYDDLTIKDIDYDGYDTYWDGYRAHIAFKFGDRDQYSEGVFAGPLFEIVQRNYLPTTSDVFTADGITYLYQAAFNPTETSYNLMLNYGGHVEENFIMVDYFFGIGAAYNKFDGGGIEYDNDIYLLNNPLLENRTPTRFSPIVRMGLTIGLSTRH